MSTKKNDSSISSMLSESTAFRKVRGKYVVENRRKQRRGKPGKDHRKQEAVKARFLEAKQYARQQISLPESKALYASRVTEKMRSAYILAMSDYLSVPKVHSIDTVDYHGEIGDPIIVKATDDFMVTKVKVLIYNAAGAKIEEGNAGPDAEGVNLWEYKATTANPSLSGTKIKAIAYDRPGNKGTAEVVL